MHRALYLLIAVLLMLPTGSVSAQATADQDYTVLRQQLQNLLESVNNMGGLQPGNEDVIRAIREQFTAFTTRWPQDPRGPAGVLQTSMWLDDDGAVLQASEQLFALRPDDDRLRLALVDYFKQKNRFDRALSVAGDYTFDFQRTPSAALTLAECLYAEHRFQEALDNLATIEADAALRPRADQMTDQIQSAMELWSQEQELRSAEAATGDLPRVEIDTDKGLIVVELFENEAPNTVANFVSLAESGFYTGTKFHRVEKDPPMAQGGDPNSREDNPGIPGQGGPGYRIKDEHTTEPYRKHFTGSLAMAKTAIPDSAGCQFYITQMPIPHLNGQHTVFGRVVDGMVVAQALEVDDEILGMKVTRKRLQDYTPQTISTSTPTITPVPVPPTQPTP